MLTAEQYQTERDRINKFNEWLDTQRDGSGWASYRPEDVPPRLQPAPTNADRSAVEVYEWLNNPPERYFLYIKEDTREAITFRGDVIGRVVFGCEWRDNFGGARVPVDVIGTNGKRYHGTYFKSSGDYARIRQYKNQ